MPEITQSIRNKRFEELRAVLSNWRYPFCSRRAGSALIFALAAFIASESYAQIIPNDPVPVNGATTDSGADSRADIATDELGVWITVWTSTDDMGGPDGTDEDIFSSTTLTNGASWSAAVKVNINDASPTRTDEEPQIDTDGAGTWITAWVSDEDVVTNGTDNDVLYSRSFDNGATWSSSQLLTRTGAPAANDGDAGLAITTNRVGDWVAIYASTDDANQGFGTDPDILASRSLDNGSTWLGPVAVNRDAATDISTAFDNGTDGLSNVRLALVSDRESVFIAAWTSTHDFDGVADTDKDIFYARSTDNGATWTGHGVLNSYANGDTRVDANISLATDFLGNWIAVWNTDFDNGVSGFDDDIFVSRSVDNGVTWSNAELLNSNGAGDIRADESPVIRTDGTGNWIVTWDSDDNIGGTSGDDLDMFVSLSKNIGTTWSTPRLLHANGGGDTGGDSDGTIETDRSGNWISVWSSNENFAGAGIDADIFSGSFALGLSVNESLSGRVTAMGDQPVTCAVVEATLQGGNIKRTAVTDLNGRFLFDSLSATTYDLIVFAPDWGRIPAGSANLSAGPVTGFDIDIAAANLGRSITGQILDTDTAEALVGVRVVALFNNAPVALTYTCATGDYVLVLPDTLKGNATVDLELQQQNYDTKTVENVDVPPEGTLVNETMTKSVGFPASLGGAIIVVNKGTGDPLQGARVTITGPANFSSTSDAMGLYGFGSILEGFYTISASAEGYASQFVNKNILSEEAAVQSFEMETGNPPADVNDDGSLNATDVQLVINGALGLPIGSANSDVNNDGSTTAVDVQLVINAVLGII